MVAAPFAALLLAIAQTSLVFFGQQNLETTAQKVARQLTQVASMPASTKASTMPIAWAPPSQPSAFARSVPE